jgi:general L-amino acid transport system permease protein
MATQALPPRKEIGAIGWIRKNLFGTWYDAVLTVIVALIAIPLIFNFINWTVTTARWSVVTENLSTLMKGIYPTDQVGRLVIAVLVLVGLTGISWGAWGARFRNTAIALFGIVIVFLALPYLERRVAEAGSLGAYLNTQLLPLLDALRNPILTLLVFLGGGIVIGRVLLRVDAALSKRAIALCWLLLIPIIFVLVRGIAPNAPALPLVETNRWGGLLLTLMLAFVASVLCFPLGILLALGRTSGGRRRMGEKGLRGWLRSLGNLPVIKLFCILYIELFRGAPLVAVLYTGNLLVGFALGSAEIDSVVRAMVALTLFEAAYVAEIVRGGLQALPPGQAEAAKAIGLNPIQSTVLIVLPQALRTVIPSLVGQFITLVKDTSLVAVISLTDLLYIADSVRQKAEYSGTQREMYIFVASVYFVICYAMSIAARRIERSGSGRITAR